MINRLGLVATAVASFAVSVSSVAQAQPFDYSFTVDVISGPLVGDRYTGITSVELDDLLGSPIDGSIQSVSVRLALGGVEFTETQDVQDIDAQSPRANFENGEFLGTTYIVSRFGNNPTDIPLINGVFVDGFAIDNSQFGYVVGANFYQGTVNYNLPLETSTAPIQSVPEPSLLFGLVGAGYWLIRRNS